MAEPRLWLIVEQPADHTIRRLVEQVERIRPHGVIINNSPDLKQAVNGARRIITRLRESFAFGMSCLDNPAAGNVAHALHAGFSAYFMRQRIARSGRPASAMHDITRLREKAESRAIFGLAGSCASTPASEFALNAACLLRLGVRPVMNATQAYDQGRLGFDLPMPSSRIGEVYLAVSARMDTAGRGAVDGVTDILVSQLCWH